MQACFLSLIQKPHVKDVFEIFQAHNVEIRIVGGAVRDAILGLEVDDIDLAVACSPNEATKILTPYALVKPTGLKFGTITAVFPHNHFQITSLRKDIKTDGRHAEVIFGGTFEEDALRRDFTLNALSLDGKGALFDYFEGEEDLASGHIRFIGDARARIREDYLRILRFFRMHAYFGKDTPEGDAINACSELKAGLRQLSRERIRMEFFKILKAPKAESIISLMEKAGILDELCDGSDIPSFISLCEKEAKYGVSVSPLRRLLALFPRTTIDDLDKQFVLMRCEVLHLETVKTMNQESSLLEILYYHGKERARDFVLLYKQGNTRDLLSTIDSFEKPSFPVSSKDLMNLGFSGKDLGNALDKLELSWIHSKFSLTKTQLIAAIKQEN